MYQSREREREAYLKKWVVKMVGEEMEDVEMDVGRRREVGVLGDEDAHCSCFLLWSLERN